ncbi:sulfatase family protein [Sunxiuqinia elliptica]|uniref:Uncharacterized sulfatase n=1 Tax=Sunxiuqinia elliptica TaxID=655355 RepID=A0A1I2GVR3_9BACT|nr:sulfatase [Sunxiuqinia elliptica]SFF20671.1 uncharacterized sulfatase [Sunxiuqinia elliptica]
MKRTIGISGMLLMVACTTTVEECKAKRPNIIIAISDDQSFAHTSFAGCTFVRTPAFDRVAREGIYFSNCIAGSPGCAPSRSSLVTGRHHWQNEQSGQHFSGWLDKYVPFVDLLSDNGYLTGYTGKGVAPFQYHRNHIEEDSFRIENAAGKGFNQLAYDATEKETTGLSSIDYYANFKAFMSGRKDDQPFYFWYGGYEPHRVYEKGAWKRSGKKLENVQVPGFLPDTEEIRGDILDYAMEIEWFDKQLLKMINYLEEIGELENTIIIVTSDNGMPFPRAKALCVEYGIHVPLAIRYPQKFPGGRVVEDVVSFIDFAPTILELTETTADGMMPVTGKSLVEVLTSDKDGMVDRSRQFAFSGRERHSSSRWKNLGYPQRAIRNNDFLYVWNMKPDRWPAGAPQRLNPDQENELLPLYGIDEQGKHHSDWAFTDVDGSPAKSYIVEHFEEKEVRPFFDLAFEKQPEEMLYNIKEDPFCLNNLIEDKNYSSIRAKLKQELRKELIRTGDPRMVGSDEGIFETYKRYSSIRAFPKPKEAGNNNF